MKKLHLSRAVCQTELVFDAIRLGRLDWKKKHHRAICEFEPVLTTIAQSVLRQFKMPTTDQNCADSKQMWWELVLRDQLRSLKPSYGLGKYARVFMSRAVGRVADQNGRRRARPNKNDPKDPAGIRRSPKHRVIGGVSAELLMETAVSNELTPPEQLIRLQTTEAVRAEISRLHDNLRTPLIHVYYDGLSVNETAARLNITPNAVSGRLFRAKRDLRIRLRESCD